MNPDRKRDRRKVKAQGLLRELDEQSLRGVVREVLEAVRGTNAREVIYIADQLRKQLGPAAAERARSGPVPEDRDTGIVVQDLVNRVQWIHVDHDDVGRCRVTVFDHRDRLCWSADVFIGQAVANIIAKLEENEHSAS